MLGLVIAWAMDYAGMLYLDEIRYGDSNTPYEEDVRADAEDFDDECEEHLRLAWGAEVIGIRIGSFKCNLNNLREAKQIVLELENIHGKSPYVRLRKDLYFQARDEPKKNNAKKSPLFLCLAGHTWRFFF